MKEKIILIGGGGHCRSCIDVIEMEGKYEISGIIDTREKSGEKILGYKIIGTDDDLESLASAHQNFIITIGHLENPARRIEIFNNLKSIGVHLPVIVSPLAHVSKHAKVEEGTIIMHYAMVNSGAMIGKNCIINTKALVEHDTQIGNHCHISTSATVNGNCNVGDRCFIGSNSTVVHQRNVPSNTFIRAHSLFK